MTAPVAPPPNAAPAAVAPPPPAGGTSPGGITQAQFGAQVNAYAQKYGAAGTKQRFKQMADAFQQAGWTSTSAIPAEQYDNVLPWFQVQE
jgi:hypothetical protein